MNGIRSAQAVAASAPFCTARRQFTIAAVGFLFLGSANAQRKAGLPRVGVLGVAPGAPALDRALDEGLRAFGYFDGKNIEVIRRHAGGNIDLLPQVARDLVRDEVDVIITGLNPATSAARNATRTIPIVMLIGTDVVGSGFARSLARPGENITGFAWDLGDGGGIAKRVELLKEAVPALARLAILWEPPYEVTHRPSIDAAAKALGITTLWFRYTGNTKRDFADIAAWGADAAYQIVGSLGFTKRSELASAAIERRMPVMYTTSFYADGGGLMSYGPDMVDITRSAAKFIDRILKGASPGDLPIEHPTRFELVINLRTARAIGLKIPQVTLMRAARVIE